MVFTNNKHPEAGATFFTTKTSPQTVVDWMLEREPRSSSTRFSATGLGSGQERSSGAVAGSRATWSGRRRKARRELAKDVAIYRHRAGERVRAVERAGDVGVTGVGQQDGAVAAEVDVVVDPGRNGHQRAT